MKYKNVSGIVKNMKMSNDWVSVEPEESLDLSESVAESDGGFELVVKQKKKQEPKEQKEPEEPDKPNKPNRLDLLDEPELKKKTKDGLNDYAAMIGLEEVNSSMKKSEMINKILKYQDDLN